MRSRVEGDQKDRPDLRSHVNEDKSTVSKLYLLRMATKKGAAGGGLIGSLVGNS